MNKNIKTVILIIIVIAIILALLFISFKDKDEISKDIISVAIVPEIEFVKAVAGDDFEIVTMIPPGASPENYEPTPLEKEKFEKSKFYIRRDESIKDNSI